MRTTQKSQNHKFKVFVFKIIRMLCKKVVDLQDLKQNLTPNHKKSTMVIIGFVKDIQVDWFKKLSENLVRSTGDTFFLMVDIDKIEGTVLEEYQIKSRTIPTVVILKNQRRLAKLKIKKCNFRTRMILQDFIDSLDKENFQ